MIFISTLGKRKLKHFTMVTQVLTQVLKKMEKLGMMAALAALIDKITKEGDLISPLF